MDLMHLIKNYYYLKFFVDVYDEYIKECPETEDCQLSDIGRKNETAKTFLSYIEMALAVPPFVCFRYAFFFDYSKYVWLAVGVIAVVLIGYSVTSGQG